MLREQITGIRVVRAFVREPYEKQRFGKANDDLTDVAVARGPLDGDDVPAGDPGRERLERRRDLVRRAPHRQRPDAGRRADRLPLLPDADPDVGDDGDLHADDDPAGLGLRRPHRRGARHRRPRCRSRTTRSPRTRRSAATSTSQHVTFAYPGAEEPVLRRRLVLGPARPDGRRHRLDRCRQDHPGQPGAAALRRHRRRGPRRRDRRTTGGPGPALAADRAGAAEGVPLQRHRPQQPPARQAGRDRRGDVGGARGRAGPRLRRGAARRARLAGRPGRHQLLGRPAAAARDRAGADPQARHLPLRRLVLGARPGDRRPAAGGAEARRPATRPW